jgi:hypothetical protein
MQYIPFNPQIKAANHPTIFLKEKWHEVEPNQKKAQYDVGECPGLE